MEINLSSITLRPFRLTDTDDIMVWAGDDQVTKTLRRNTITSKDEALTFINDVRIPHRWRRSICIDDHSIGFVSVLPGQGDDRCRAEIGYAVAAKYWGQGIATRAVQIALPQVFKDFPDVVRIQAFAMEDNKASQRVLEKAGFHQEGLLKRYTYVKGKMQDLYIYSFLSTDCPSGDV